MGEGKKFTVYYYEALINYVPGTVPFNVNSFYPVVANIISGEVVDSWEFVTDTLGHRIDSTKTQYIRDFRWGKEVLGYFKDGTTLQQIIALGRQPGKGDAWFLNNSGKNVTIKHYDSPMQGE